MNKITYCYHSHTYRCGHAIGEDEDYIKQAIKFGLKDYGVSDHVILPNIIQPGMRGACTLLDDYLSSIKSLKAKYKKQINVYTGFECEYLPEFVDYYRSLLKEKKVDYLILGQHCYFKNNQVVWYHHLDRETCLKLYTEHLINGIKSGIFMYVAHPDLYIGFTERWDALEQACAKKIIEAAVKYNMPLEINLAHSRIYGMRHFANTYSYYQYPFTPFWELVAKSKAKVVVGFDAHRPIDVLHPGLEAVEHIEKVTGVKVIYNLSIKDKKNKI